MTVSIADRRAILKAMMAAGGGAAGLFPSILRAMDIPAHRRTGTIADVAHVVILTQENRAFDHYFGAMNGVRGFADRFAIPVPDAGARKGRTVFVQPGENDPARQLTPFHVDTAKDFRLIRIKGTPHNLTDAHQAWDQGRMSAWPQAKHNHAMGYFTRADIPFQYALAEAFTLCDAYHCSLMGPTNPNRLHIWTGTNDPEGTHNGPAIDNSYDHFADPFGHGGYTWTTYPERLQQAGISFQIYQDMDDNFTDNPMPGFQVIRRAREAKDGPLADLARRTVETRDIDKLKTDVEAGKLPQVSWIIAPGRYSEHPSASTPLQGAEYTARVLDALTANPDVWARTVLLVNFDENDGLYDHVPPPCPPSRDPADPSRLLGSSTVPLDRMYHVKAQGDADRPYLNQPYGLGPRVPMIAVSPWSKGGYVASEVFDHTSVIRFLEKRFGVIEPNIAPWRRAVCGDLTSCFDFAQADERAFMDALPATAALSEKATGLPEVVPPMPSAPEAPMQETGLRRRRAAPYRLEAEVMHGTDGAIRLNLSNASRPAIAAVFQIYDVADLAAPPQRHTVGAGRTMTIDLPASEGGSRDLFVLGPNGFHRRLRGTRAGFGARLEARGEKAHLVITPFNDEPMQFAIRDMAYGAAVRTLAAKPGRAATLTLDFAGSHGWYDVLVEGPEGSVRLAGHIETGGVSLSDPAAHGAAPLDFA